MLSKLKSTKQRLSKWVVTACVAVSMAMMSCITCFAAEESSSPDFSAQLGTAFNNMKDDILSYIVVVLPIALAVVGVFFGIKKAISFFQKTANKGG